MSFLPHHPFPSPPPLFPTQEKREATAFRIKDINTRNREFELRVSAAAGAKAQAERTGDAPSTKDPFARIENRGTNYYTIGAAKAAPIPKGAAAPAKTPEGGAGLSVAVPPPAAGVADAVSPGFRDLLATPRTPGGGLAASAHLDDAAAAAAEAAAAAFGGDVAGSTGAAGAGEGGGEEPSGRVGKPPLVGQKVGAHLVSRRPLPGHTHTPLLSRRRRPPLLSPSDDCPFNSFPRTLLLFSPARLSFPHSQFPPHWHCYPRLLSGHRAQHRPERRRAHPWPAHPRALPHAGRRPARDCRRPTPRRDALCLRLQGAHGHHLSGKGL
jgi:hypothetical protein